MTRKAAAPTGPCVGGSAHFWLLVNGRDAEGRHGQVGTCKDCKAERFWPALGGAERYRRYGRLPRYETAG